MKPDQTRKKMSLGRKLHNSEPSVGGSQCRRRDSAGFTLIETACAAAILMITLAGVAALFASSFKSNFWQGDTSTRTVEYAQDKMESLLALNFSDSSTDTTVWPYCNATVYLPGTSTPACLPTVNLTGLNPGGSVGAAALAHPTTGYYDYLTVTGDIQTNSTNAAYIRVWKITADSATNPTLKTITVQAATLTTTPQVSTTLVCIKTKTK